MDSGETCRRTPETGGKIWAGSKKTVNPRHLDGFYRFINHLKLLDQKSGVYQITGRSEKFLADDPELLNELDSGEGIPYLLTLAEEAGSFKHADLIDDWSLYLQAVSRLSAVSVFKDTMRRRLLNMVDRGLLSRESNRYEITRAGREYLKRFPHPVRHTTGTDKSDVGISGQNETGGVKHITEAGRSDVFRTVQAYNQKQTEALKQRLTEMDPYKFEHFIRELLVAMDYENVEVTKQSGDRGVDVVANFQFGITEITEVVQVKRQENNIGRPVIDALRGALPYHGAIRGTIITLGGFARDVESWALYPGAAPITLIDGEQLIKLVIKHGIGVKRIPLDLWDIDEAFFTARDDALEEDTI